MQPRHVLLAVVLSVFWGLNFVVMKVGLQGFPPIFMAAARFFLAALPALGALAACTVGPDYKRPTVATPAAASSHRQMSRAYGTPSPASPDPTQRPGGYPSAV